MVRNESATTTGLLLLQGWTETCFSPNARVNASCATLALARESMSRFTDSATGGMGDEREQ